MRAVIQRVEKASVTIVDIDETRMIDQGLVVLLGVEEQDKTEDAEWLARKISGMRIFSDSEDKMNLSVTDIGGSILVISQFTLHASTKKGSRPSFIRAAKPDIAIPLYKGFVDLLRKQGHQVQTGEFGAMMKVDLINDGPVTIIVDTKNKE